MDLNAFKLCKGLRALGYAIVLLVAAIVALSYYAVVVLTWGPHLLHHGSPLALIVIVLFHLLLVMLAWCYVRVVVTDPGGVPRGWTPEGQEPASLEDGSNPEGRPRAEGEEVLGLQDFRYCRHCNNWKPPRSHHCSVCQRCVLKMDHHCVWVVNCVGAHNYKFFLLFLVYTFLETMLDTLALLPAFVHFFKKAKDHSSSPGSLAVTFLAFVLNLAFVLSLLCFVMMHASLVLSNTTSIEVHEKEGAVRWRYDLGRKKNVEQVLGSKKALWFIPMFSKEDLEHTAALKGLEFPTHSDVDVL